MKILIVDELCYPQLGGIQVRFKALAEQWTLMGHDVHVTAIDHLATSLHEEVIEGVNYHRIIKDADYYKSGLFGRKISTIIKYTFKLRPYLKRDWDIIIFCQFPMLPQIIYKFFYKKRAKTALDFVEHRNSKMWKIINNTIINAADKVICISNHIKECVNNYRKNDLFVTPSFVDTTLCIAETKLNYIFLGRLEEHKHPELAIEAVIAYNKRYAKNIRLDIVGSGSLYNILKTKYIHMQFIKFAGRVDDKQKHQLLTNSRILLLPSEREGLPIVVIEAMSYGVPTITTDYPGNGTQFFVNEEKIGLVASPTVDDIVDKIQQIELKYDTYANRCNEIKENYDLKLISKRYLDTFK